MLSDLGTELGFDLKGGSASIIGRFGKSLFIGGNVVCAGFNPALSNSMAGLKDL